MLLRAVIEETETEIAVVTFYRPNKRDAFALTKSKKRLAQRFRSTSASAASSARGFIFRIQAAIDTPRT